jgi:hypothetical protein
MNVNALHTSAITAIAFLRLQRSTRYATGSEKAAMLRKNSVCREPACASVRPSASFIGCITAAKTCRSM